MYPAYAHAAEDPASRLPEISGHLAVLEDASATLTLADVLTPAQQERFRPVTGRNINLGYTRSVFWVRLSLPATADGQGILSMHPNYLDRVDFYSAKPDEGAAPLDYMLQQTGDHLPLLRNGVSGLTDAMRVAFAAGKTTRIYIRISNGNSSTQADFRLVPVEEFGLDLTRTTIAFSLWFGCMGILIVVQLIFFLFDRKPEYPLLALSTLFLTLINVGNLGLSRVLLFPDGGTANDVFLGFSAWGALCAFALSHSKLLNLRQKSVWLHRLYCCFAAVGLAGVVFAFLGENVTFGPIGSAFIIGVVPLNMFLALRYAREDGMASLLRAAAFSILGLGSVAAIIQRLGFLWVPNWVFYAYGQAGLIQLVLLTGVMAVRLRDAERRESVMQAQALEAAQSAERRAAALVRQRTAELVEAKKAAENALQAEMQSQVLKVRFLEVLSHQYRTPLSAIRASADSIAFSLAKDDGANRSRVERIRRSVAWLVQILEVNLERSLLQGASFRPEPAPVTAGNIVTSAFQRAQDLLNNPEITLTIDEQAAQTVVHADSAMMELAILNLLENAVKYTAQKANAPIVLSLSQTKTGIVIMVCDRGIGIPAKDLPHVFEGGVRGSNAGAAEGSGLGLSLVARIVAAHAGTTRLESDEGKGTTARIVLPLPQ